MNGNGIQPTVELATNNGAYPVYPAMYGNNGYGNGGFLGGEGIWAILLFAMIFGNGGWGNGGFGFGGNVNNDFAWLSNGQKDIMTNTNNGFDTLHLSNQLDTVNSGIYSLSNQMCNSTSDITSAINNGFYNTEIAANNRAINQMQDTFALSRQFADCCCENRLANCQTQNIIQNEGNATRFADANNTRDIITNATSNTQAILDKLCQLELDGKQDRINQLEREVLMKDLQASQVSQTAQLRLSEEQQFDSFYNRLKNCPVNAVAVYGNTPVFTCPGNNGCGCGFNTTSQFI